MAIVGPSYELIVIGGGPAGSSAALDAARRGVNVLVLEKRPMPRPKLCGGWVSARAQRYLRFEVPAEIIAHPFQHLEVRCASAGSMFSPREPLGAFIDRAVFDLFLLQQAEQEGAEIKFERALSITQAGGIIEVQTRGGSYRALRAVICTGAAGTFSAMVRPADPPWKLGVCLQQRVSAEHADVLGIVPGTARLYFGDISFGYGWVLHHGKYLLIGLGRRRSHNSNLRPSFDRHWQVLGLPDALRAPAGCPIPLGGFRRPLGDGRCLLAGDAAGFVDAFTGEGIAFAIRSGQLAAEALLSPTQSDPVSTYRRLCRKEILSPLRQSLWISRLFHHLPRKALERLCADPRTAEGYSAVLRGERSYFHYGAQLAAHTITAGH